MSNVALLRRKYEALGRVSPLFPTLDEKKPQDNPVIIHSALSDEKLVKGMPRLETPTFRSLGEETTKKKKSQDGKIRHIREMNGLEESHLRHTRRFERQ